MSRERVGERDVSEQVALAEQRGAVAFVVLGVSWVVGVVAPSAGEPRDASRRLPPRLLGGVAEDEPALARVAWVHDRAGGCGGELREHLGA